MGRVAVFAHRGASRARRENTLEAFDEAARLGADGVELDVRRGGDGSLVVHHDATLPDGRPLCEVPAGDLPGWVPLLDAAVEACAGMVVNIEVKNLPGEPDFDPDQGVAASVARFVRERDLAERVIVSSFNLLALDRVRSEGVAIPTAWLTMAGWDQERAAETAADHGHRGLHPAWPGITAEVVEAAHHLGLFVNTWTVDDPDAMREAAELGVDGIVTNVPDVALQVLAHWR